MNKINNTDDQEKEIENFCNQYTKSPVNESSGIYIRGFIKISDPDTGEVLVHTAD
jgi:hypothetical protein